MKRIVILSCLILSMIVFAACSKTDAQGMIRLEGNAEKFSKDSFHVKAGDNLTFILANKDVQYAEIKGLDVKVTKEKTVEVQVKTSGIYEIDGIVGPGKFIKSELIVQ